MVPLPNFELLRNIVLDGWFVGDDSLARAIKHCEQLPKIRAVVVDCDPTQMERVTLGLSIPSIAKGSNLTCVDVGVYKVDTATSEMVYYEQDRVVKVWKAFQAIDGTVSFDQLYVKHRANDRSAAANIARILSAAEILALYDEWRGVERNEPHTQEALEVMDGYLLETLISSTSWIPKIHPKLRPDIRLGDIGKSVRDQELMDSASQLVDLNSRNCRRLE